MAEGVHLLRPTPAVTGLCASCATLADDVALPQLLPQSARRDHQCQRINLQLSGCQRVSKHAAPVTGGQVVAGSNPASLLPGRIATPRARQINEAAAARSGIPVADVEQSSTGETPAGRYGERDGFGAVAALLVQRTGVLRDRSSAALRRRVGADTVIPLRRLP